MSTIGESCSSLCKRTAGGCAGGADFQALPGNGLSGTLDGASLAGGSFPISADIRRCPHRNRASFERRASEGKDTAVLFMKNGHLAGMIAVADVIKEDSPAGGQGIAEHGNPCGHADRR